MMHKKQLRPSLVAPAGKILVSMKFKYRAYLPTLDISIPLTELSTRDYISIVKYVINDDSELIEEAFESILQAHVSADIYDKLTRLDKFFILCTIRAVSVAPSLSLTFNDDKSIRPYTSRIALFDILQNIADTDFTHNRVIDLNDDLSISITLPTKLSTDSVDDMLLDCISTLTISGTTHNIKEYTVPQRKTILDTLPGKVISSLHEYVADSSSVFGDIVLFKKLNPYDTSNLPEEYKVNLFDNSLMSFLMTGYSESIKYIYDVIYILSRKCHFSSDVIYNSTFAEVRMYVDLYEEELKEREKALADQEKKNSTSTMPTLGGAPPGGGIS